MEQLDISKNVPHSLSYTHTLSNSLCLLKSLQSIDTPNHRSIDQSIDWSINPSVNPSIDQPIDSSIHRPFDWSIHPSIHHSIDIPIDWSIHQSINRSIHWSMHWSIDPSIHRFWPKSWIVIPQLQHIVIFYVVEDSMLYCWWGDSCYYYFLQRRARQLCYSCLCLSFKNFFEFLFSFRRLEGKWASPMQHL